MKRIKLIIIGLILFVMCIGAKTEGGYDLGLCCVSIAPMHQVIHYVDPAELPPSDNNNY